MNKTLRNNILPWLIIIVFALIVITTFGKPYVLKSYIETTIGDCAKVPILCIRPSGMIQNPEVDKEFINGLTRYKFGRMEIALPKDFTVVKERIFRAYYKKHKRKPSDSVAYLLLEKEDFFLSLFPQLKKLGLKTNYDFLSRIVAAQTRSINNLSDTLFVILKSVFTPDLGTGQGIKIVNFQINDKKGFIYYNACAEGNFFNCDIVNNEGEFFKIYLKDKKAKLDLNKVLAIISTLGNEANSDNFK